MKVSSLVLAAALSVQCEAFAPKSFEVHRPSGYSPIMQKRNHFAAQANDDTNLEKTESDSFQNDSTFSFMTNFLTLHRPGKSMAYGIPLDVVSNNDNRKEATPDEIAQQKQNYRNNVMNIGMEERERRRQAGKIFAVITVAYVLWSALIVDQGDFLGHLVRFGSFLPLFLTLGYRESADKGL